MEDGVSETQTNEQPQAEHERQQPSAQWKKTFSGAWQDFSPRYFSNLLFMIIGLLVAPAVGVVMNKPKVVIAGFALGVTILIWVGAVLLMKHAGQTSSRESAQAGLTLQDPTFREHVERMSVIIGGNDFRIASNAFAAFEKGEIIPVQIAGFAPVRIKTRDGKLYTDVEIYSGADEPPFAIRDNQFVLRLSGWDRNSSDKALEVVNRDNRPMFQLVYETPARIKINGIFPLPGGQLLMAAGDGSLWNPSPERCAAFRLKPIFKYPSWKYPGEYSDSN